MDTETQLELFAHAVEALGGQRSAARAIDISERNLARLMKGERRLHAGILEDICKALIAHADRCKVLERQLSPAFSTNRTEAQAKPPLHAGNHAQGMTPIPADDPRIVAAARKLGLTPIKAPIKD